MKAKKAASEFIVTLSIFLICFYLIIDGKFISRLNENAMRLPRLIFIALMFLCAIEMIRFFVYNRKAEGKPRAAIKNVRNFVTGLVFLAGYCFALYLIGFIPATIALCLGYGFLYHYKRPLLMILYTFISVMLVWFVFSSVLGVPLPAGVLFSRF